MLLGVFGTVIAALLPAGLAVAAVVVTGAVIYFLSLSLTMSVFVTNITSMLGIGVAVDYCLFVLSRYRDELTAGKNRDAALDTAMRTSGATVVFSGITVIVSLAGLFLLDAAAIHSLAIGAITVVAVSIIGAVTLLPALIALPGRRVEGRGAIVNFFVGLYRRVRPQAQAARLADVLGALDGRRHAPLGALGGACRGVLLALAIPALSLQFGNGALRQFPDGYETKAGFELASAQVAPGEAAPLLVVVDADGPIAGGQAQLDAYAAS